MKKFNARCLRTPLRISGINSRDLKAYYQRKKKPFKKHKQFPLKMANIKGRRWRVKGKALVFLTGPMDHLKVIVMRENGKMMRKKVSAPIITNQGIDWKHSGNSIEPMG